MKKNIAGTLSNKPASPYICSEYSLFKINTAMENIANKTTVLKGGEFIVRESVPEETFIPEELNEEQKMAGQMTQDFLDQEVYPNVLKISADNCSKKPARWGF
jgi:hypothetical protein